MRANIKNKGSPKLRQHYLSREMNSHSIRGQNSKISAVNHPETEKLVPTFFTQGDAGTKHTT